tara:strand:- start:215 stop:394 length:180 start_codon:yes stop_codon:yes gene_type:complete
MKVGDLVRWKWESGVQHPEMGIVLEASTHLATVFWNQYAPDNPERNIQTVHLEVISESR